MADRKNKAGAGKASASKANAKPQTLAEQTPAVLKAPLAPEDHLPAAEPVIAETAIALVDAAHAPLELETLVIEAADAATETNTTTEGTTTMNTETIEQVQETQRVATDRIQAAFGDVNERSRETMQKSARIIEEMTDLTRGNVEALVASSKVAARGVEQLGQEVADFSRRSFEQASATLKSFTEVRSATDLFRLQSDYARTAFDSMVSESSKMSEAMIKLTGEVAQPITSRYAVAAERVKNVAL